MAAIPAWLVADLPMLARALAKLPPHMNVTFRPPEAVCDPIPVECADELSARLGAMLPADVLARCDGVRVAVGQGGRDMMLWLAPIWPALTAPSSLPVAEA